jgi:cell division protein FtsB
VKWLAIALGVVVAILQYRLWLSDGGVRELARMQAAVTEQRAQNTVLVERNRQLAAEVRDLVVPAKPDAARPPAAQVAAR